MKPTLGEDKVSTGGIYKLAAGSTLDIQPFFGAPFGKVAIVPPMAWPQLKNSRKLRLYLPPSYQENTGKRYPVLYMHAGKTCSTRRRGRRCSGTEKRVKKIKVAPYPG